MDLSYATASELVAALAAGDLSSVELVDHVLARIDEVNGPLNAVVHTDPERARREAAAADAARARGDALGPLHGLAITVKDVWETEGMVTTSGAPELADHVPDRDAVAVGRLRAAGAVIVGKTNTPLYAGDNQTFNEVYGRTNNPWALDRTTGGSSGGAAAAVAAGITSFELGSDIGGSIRAPAHFCGVYGLKPSWRVVPSRGHIPGPPGSLVEVDVNQGGPLARSVADLRLGLDVLAGPLDDEAVAWTLDLPEGDDVTSLAGLRVAVTFDDDTFKVSSDVQSALRSFVDALSDAGAAVTEEPPPVPMVDGLDTWQSMVLPIIGTGLPDEVYDAFSGLDAHADEPIIRAGGQLTMRYRDWSKADAARQQQRQAWQRWFTDRDVFLAPIMPTSAFPHDTETPTQERTLAFDDHVAVGLDLVAWAGAIGAMWLPAAVIPAGSAPDGLPVGIQVVGPYLHDRRLLHIATAMDRVGPGFRRPPGY